MKSLKCHYSKGLCPFRCLLSEQSNLMTSWENHCRGNFNTPSRGSYPSSREMVHGHGLRASSSPLPGGVGRSIGRKNAHASATRQGRQTCAVAPLVRSTGTCGFAGEARAQERRQAGADGATTVKAEHGIWWRKTPVISSQWKNVTSTRLIPCVDAVPLCRNRFYIFSSLPSVTPMPHQ